MENKKYIPFLKTKMNEIHSLKELSIVHQSKLTPFFDIVKKENLTEKSFKKNLADFKKKMNTHLKDIPYFYIDNYDIDSNFYIDGIYNYTYVLDFFKDSKIVPVISIDRNIEHVESISDAVDLKSISSKLIAIRLTEEDFEDFSMVEDDIKEVIEVTINKFENIDLILDCRVCNDLNVQKTATNIIDFYNEFIKKYAVRKLIITGSSIPAQINTLINTGNDKSIIRNEIAIFEIVRRTLSNIDSLVFSDYTIVSPDYSDISIPKEVLRNVMAPKIVYSYDDKHHIWRGNALGRHPREELQYNDISSLLIKKPFFRGEPYSFGDNFIFQKSQGIGSLVTASSILKPTINAHIVYMLNRF